MHTFAGYLFLLLCIGLYPALSRAQDRGAISLLDLEQEALTNNPEINMAARKAEAAVERKSLASALPDPMIGVMVQNVGALGTSTVGKEEMSMQGVVFTQEIPFPGKLSTKGRAAANMAGREQENSRETRLKVLNSLRTAYYDYCLAYRSAEILDEARELMKNFQRIAETRYATGQGMQQDVIRAQLEVSMLLDKIAEEDRKKEAQAALINSLVGRNPLLPLGRPAEPPRRSLNKNLEEMAAMAQAHSPMLKGKQQMVEQSEAELSMSRREYLPDMVLSAGMFTRGDFKDVWQASLMFKVPLYFWNKSTGVKAANADLHAAHYEYEAEKLALLARIRDIYAMVNTAEHHLHLYTSGIIPQARMALQSTSSNYQVGKTDFMALLEAQNTLLKYQLMEQEELVNLSKNQSMLGEITGEEHE
jgi:cobalt-zinc-cadmium efflux system outer membrane protein